MVLKLTDTVTSGSMKELCFGTSGFVNCTLTFRRCTNVHQRYAQASRASREVKPETCLAAASQEVWCKHRIPIFLEGVFSNLRIVFDAL
eukprot:gene19930-biopygen6400